MSEDWRMEVMQEEGERAAEFPGVDFGYRCEGWRVDLVDGYVWGGVGDESGVKAA